MHAARERSCMSAVPVPSAPLAFERNRGRVALTAKLHGTRTRLQDLFQEGSGKIKLPNVAPGAPLEAVLINTGGGLTGGDRFAAEIAIGAGASAVATTQACEKIYRSAGGRAEIATHLRLAAGASLAWLPQETIVYDGGAFTRTLAADIAATSRLLAVEAIVLGRTARGETVTAGALGERWRIRRDGRLVYADGFALEGAIEASMRGRALGNGARAFATILDVAPDAALRLDAVRAAIDAAGEGIEAGASAWDGLLAVRLLAADGTALRRTLVMILTEMMGRALPRVWSS